jgi:hypothetical protein
MAISATYNFTPSVSGGQVAVTGNTESEIKAAVLAVLAARKAAQQANVDALQSAENGMNG